MRERLDRRGEEKDIKPEDTVAFFAFVAFVAQNAMRFAIKP